MQNSRPTSLLDRCATIIKSSFVHMACIIIQLMRSFEVNIKICQPENSDVHRGKAEVSITFEGWLILMSTKKECTNYFVI